MGNVHSSSTESHLSDSDNDTWELNDVKLIPQVSTFVQESQENVRKHGRCKENTYLVEPINVCREPSLADKPNFLQYQQIPKELSRHRYTENFLLKNDEPIAFKTGCLLPEFPELRDSYDQFCTTLSQNSSVEDLDGKRSLKYLNSMETDLLDCPPNETHSARKRRKKAATTGGHNHEIKQRWSMPEFTKLWYEAIDREMIDEHSRESEEQNAVDTSESRGQDNNHDDDYCYTTTCVAEPYRPNSNKEQSGMMLIKESKSCPDIMYKELSPCFCNDSTGTSGYGSYPTTPEQQNTPDVETGCTGGYVCCCQCESQSECSHADSFIEENSETENECRASDSGYYDIGNGTKGSKVVYCNHFDQHELHENENEGKEQRGHNARDIRHQFVLERDSGKRTTFYPKIVIQKRQDCDLDKDEHCAKLVEEFRIQKKLPQLPLQNCSIYRTYDV